MAQRSPFPGMDPWLERHWGDMHHSLLQYSRDQIGGQLPSGLFAALEETVHVFDADESIGRARPDVGVFETVATSGAPSASPAGAAVATPVRIRWSKQPLVDAHIEIRSVGGGEPLVTAIEIISATNKT